MGGRGIGRAHRFDRGATPARAAAHGSSDEAVRRVASAAGRGDRGRRLVRKASPVACAGAAPAWACALRDAGGGARCAARLAAPACGRRNAMTTPQEHLEDWLRDAYAMERHAETMLKAQAARLDNYPVLRDRIQQHVEETLEQQRLLESCLQRLDTSPSAIKDLAARAAAYGQAASGLFVADEVVKGAMAGYVFEHVEIASYKTLIAAAQLAGENEIRDCCERILKQEVDMAEWMSQHLPDIAVAFLERSAAERRDAKR
ncbi:conserved hypothetical protein [Burkholderia pseudomallei 406e]|nr:conserved hypothetical protein [Burkholderia pseudomallei 406e]